MAGGDGLVWADGGAVPPFTPAALITEAEPVSLLALGLVLIACVYLYAVMRLSLAGTRWPVGRTTCFLLGLALIASVTVSGLAAYDTVLLSAHMVQHMLLAMIAPDLPRAGCPGHPGAAHAAAASAPDAAGAAAQPGGPGAHLPGRLVRPVRGDPVRALLHRPVPVLAGARVVPRPDPPALRGDRVPVPSVR